jgi:hypothetical protein
MAVVESKVDITEIIVDSRLSSRGWKEAVVETFMITSVD